MYIFGRGVLLLFLIICVAISENKVKCTYEKLRKNALKVQWEKFSVKNKMALKMAEM